MLGSAITAEQAPAQRDISTSRISAPAVRRGAVPRLRVRPSIAAAGREVGRDQVDQLALEGLVRR